MRGCAGAGSTQPRTPTCMSPPPLALHPRLDLHGFTVLSNSDRAPVFLFVLQSMAGGCKVWAGSGSRLLVLIELEPSRPLSLEPGGPVQTRRARFWIWVA